MRFLRALIAFSLVLVACSGEPVAETTTSSPASTTTTSPTSTTSTTTTTTTTTTVLNLGPTSPINGMPVSDPELLERGAIVVKIDNHANARPQAGLAEADAVIELMVEGITRFAAVFHAGETEMIGPVRSMRPTDGQLARIFGAPLLSSGGQDWVISGIRDTGTRIIGEVGNPVTFRSSSRSAPHNLYANMIEVREFAEKRDYLGEPPQPLWTFGEMPTEAESAGAITLRFSAGHTTEWTWNGTQYVKTTNGSEHLWVTADGEREQISSDTLVVLEMRTYTQSPPPGGGPAKAVESVGSGNAFVFADGRVMSGSWKRSSLSDTFTLTGSDGETLDVPPGRVWISFFDSDMTVRWSE